jgi:membrane-bound serine protease (ClpP class)
VEITGPIIIGIVCAVAFVVFIIYAIVKGQRREITAGVEEMIGKEAVVQTTLNPKGMVLAEGELWTAIAEDSRIEPGEEVIITKVEGLKLRVTKKSKEEEK